MGFTVLLDSRRQRIAPEKQANSEVDAAKGIMKQEDRFIAMEGYLQWSPGPGKQRPLLARYLGIARCQVHCCSPSMLNQLHVRNRLRRWHCADLL